MALRLGLALIYGLWFSVFMGFGDLEFVFIVQGLLGAGVQRRLLNFMFCGKVLCVSIAVYGSMFKDLSPSFCAIAQVLCIHSWSVIGKAGSN